MSTEEDQTLKSSTSTESKRMVPSTPGCTAADITDFLKQVRIIYLYNLNCLFQ